MARQMKTARQRAEEQLGVAARRAKKARDVVTRLEKELQDARDELDEADRLHAYAKQHPALQSTTTSTQEEGKA